MKFLKVIPILALTAICIAPEVLAQSLLTDGQKSHFNPGSIPRLKSQINFISNWLELFGGDGRNRAEGNTGTGTYALNDLDFSGDGRPGDRKGGASRTGEESLGNCPMLASDLTALIPETNLGLTVDGHPTFWFYVPYDTQDVSYATFMLLDEEQNQVLAAPISVPLSGVPGVIGVTLPASSKELEMDQEYHWYFTLECNSKEASSNPHVHGWVKRIAPIAGIEPNDYIAYGEHGIWYNALTSLVRMRQQDGQNLTVQQDWADLLKAVQLESLTNVSIVDCCEEVETSNGI
jgi:Domain of Unknown Function (DUF928)